MEARSHPPPLDQPTNDEINFIFLLDAFSWKPMEPTPWLMTSLHHVMKCARAKIIAASI